MPVEPSQPLTQRAVVRRTHGSQAATGPTLKSTGKNDLQVWIDQFVGRSATLMKNNRSGKNVLMPILQNILEWFGTPEGSLQKNQQEALKNVIANLVSDLS